MFIVGIVVIVIPDDQSAIVLLLWNAITLTYVIIGATYARLERSTTGDDEPDLLPWWERTRFGGLFRSAFPMLASFVGLVASLSVLLSSDLPEADAQLLRVVGVLTMVLAWLMLHIGYARRYRRDYDRWGHQGFAFPETKHPQLIDFLYFALTLGTTFATSDVNVTRRSVRWTVLVHSIIGFFYNAVVLAVAFKIITDI